jgi:hypothetical protein
VGQAGACKVEGLSQQHLAATTKLFITSQWGSATK